MSVDLSVKDLLDAGVHFGHQSKRWNPKMKHFVFGKRNGVHVIDLTKSLAHLKLACQFLYETVLRNKSVLFVGTKRQSQEILKETAIRCNQHYIISRWLGGTLTNFNNIKSSIRHMCEIENLEKNGTLASMPQKEASRLRHELTRLQRNLSGLVKMETMPGVVVVIDTSREVNAIKEARHMSIPIIAIVDTNCDPDLIDYPIPGNDDSLRAIKLIVNALSEAIVKASADYSTAAVEAAKVQAQAQADKEKKSVPAAAGESTVKAEPEAKPKQESKASAPTSSSD